MKAPAKWLRGLIVLGALTACSRDNDLPRNEQTVSGITIDLGVLPAELVRGHSTALGHPNALHCGITPYRSRAL